MGSKYFNMFVGVCVVSTSVSASFRPTMDADASEIGIEGNVLINELLAAYEEIPPVADSSSGDSSKSAKTFPTEAVCSAILPAYQERSKETYARYAERSVNGAPTSGRLIKEFRCLRFRTVYKPTDVSRHLNAGFALSDLYCDTFFRRISRHSSKRRFARGVVNDVGAAISAVLGLSGVTGALAGGVGAGFGLADGTFRNYDENFLVAADLPNLQSAVIKKQAEYRAEIAKSPPDNFADATVHIIRYANYCSFTGMRAIINYKLTEAPDPAKAMATMVDYIAQYQTLTEAVADKQKELKAAAAKAAADKKAAKAAADKAAADEAAKDSVKSDDDGGTPGDPPVATPPDSEKPVVQTVKELAAPPQ